MNANTPKTGLPPSTPIRRGVFGGSPICISRYLLTLAAILIFLAGISAASAQPRYSVTDLGVLPGYASCIPTRINDRGDVVGVCTPTVFGDGLDNTAAFVWRNGTMSAVGKLPGGHYSGATAINSLGVIIGGGDTSNFQSQAWVTTPGGLQIFSNNSNTNPLFIGDNGVIGGYYVKSGIFKGAVWTVDPKDPRKYRSTDLPMWRGSINQASCQFPTAFNQTGQAAGWGNSDQIRGTHAFFWNNDATHSIVDLGVFPGDQGSQAFGMNDLGQVAGQGFTPNALTRCVVWNNDAAHTVSELPPLPGDNYATCGSINNAGQVLGGSYYEPPGVTDFNAGVPVYRLVVWRDGDVFEFQTLLDPATGAGWTLSYFLGINNAGQIIASGFFNGQTRAILLTPMP